ncbi:hypothetical protein [Parapedobacter koreensis]|uniref:Uncharacterized protein n=1 Tax=Parapedobacter koreensis TaxID=332977 RepID=A0A1H7S7Z7_9SPHI|nr:hypothetical protein [Parapedobacter koreensis]SEL67854.1 hypothetical protein SAMN05421740_10899 [Parapedobacter koreensis]
MIRQTDPTKLRFRTVITCICLFLLPISLAQAQTYKSESLSLSIGPKGNITSLKAISSGKEYAIDTDRNFLVQLIHDGHSISPVQARFDKQLITFDFPGDLFVRIRATPHKQYLRFEVQDISKDVEALVWGNIHTSLKDSIGNTVGVVRDAAYAIGMQGLNTKTSGGKWVNQEGAIFDTGTAALSRPSGSSLQAFTINRSVARNIKVWDRWQNVPVPAIPDGQIEGSAIALFGCKPAMALPTILSIAKAEKLPYAMWQDEWIRTSKEVGRPYLITSFNESNVDTFLNLAKRMGMAGVYHEDPFDTWGHFVLKASLFPNGRNGFKTAVDKAKALGLRLGFHTLTTFLTTNDAYVTPVPSEHLMTAGSAALEQAISEQETEITVSSSEYFQMRSDLNCVRIGTELIRFREVSQTAPYRLLGCVRGAFGTMAQKHAAGTAAHRLIDHPYKVLFPDWTLQREVADNIVQFINETGANQMDFDGHEGTYATGMGDLSFNTFAEQVFRGANHPVVFGSSRANHYFWHFNHYLNWGEPWYAGFRESQADVRFANQPFLENNYLPNMLGWFLITEHTTVEDVDWMLGLAAGYHAGYALVLREPALANPNLEEIVNQINLWTEAQRSNLFSDEQRMWLKDPANDMHLYRESNQWFVQRFRKHVFEHEAQVLQPGQPTSSSWVFENAMVPQQAQYVLLASGKSGEIRNPTIELDNSFSMQIPIVLAAGESLVLDDTDAAKLYNNKGRFIKTVPLPRALPELTVGSHDLLFDAVMDASEDVKAVLSIKLLESTAQIK